VEPSADSDVDEEEAGASSPNTCVSDVCGFFLDKADTHQIAPATANTAITTSAGATNLLESAAAGALTICVRSGCPTLLESEYNAINSVADSPTSSA
jgi:flavoprotein